MAQFWGKIFLLSFAVGVVTGLIQEFQFGMNWSEYSRYVGDIFGSLLAIEALVAFFAESTFIGLWVFTWDRFKPSIHVLFIWITTPTTHPLPAASLQHTEEGPQKGYKATPAHQILSHRFQLPIHPQDMPEILSEKYT